MQKAISMTSMTEFFLKHDMVPVWDLPSNYEKPI